MNRLALVILAAGESRRFGAAKQLARIDGQPLLERVIDQCQKIRGADLHVALGARRDEIAARIDLTGVEVIHSPRWYEGIGSTIGSAVGGLQNHYEGILLLAGDQPLVGPDQLTPMILRWRQDCDLVCCAQYSGTLGIPTIFPRRLFPRLIALEGGHGAKKLLLEQEGNILTFAIPEAGVDIDRAEDMRALGQIPDV
ncbi:MAG: nucleotidyltransferase family protein [Halioglobus sp.]|nr:nucleotidyltransferase family protein [Halioglobus sp.]